MRVRISKAEAGLSTAELVIAILFASIMIVGTLGFFYTSRVDIHKAELYNTSLGIAEVFLNDWKAAGGTNDYDPISSLSEQMEIIPAEPSVSRLANLLGSYHVTVDGEVIRVTLSYKDAQSGGQPKILNAVVDWVEQRYGWDTDDPRGFVKLSCCVADINSI